MNPTGRAQLRDRVQQAVDDGVWPAAQFAVARHGEILAFESFGDARDGDRFCLFSATKPIVASLVWQLIGAGLIALETRVAEVWPEFGVHGKDTITLEQVLLHTGGFPNATISRDAVTSRDERAAAMESWRLEWPPGSRYEYHATSAHWVLAEVVHRVTGQDFRQALRARVLDPLG
ncbi:serine hydrolase domain-containing protein, partial [Nonomuraea wenchangensis]